MSTWYNTPQGTTHPHTTATAPLLLPLSPARTGKRKEKQVTTHQTPTHHHHAPPQFCVVFVCLCARVCSRCVGTGVCAVPVTLFGKSENFNNLTNQYFTPQEKFFNNQSRFSLNTEEMSTETTVKASNWRLVEVGRVVLVNKGQYKGKLATIVEIIDHKRVSFRLRERRERERVCVHVWMLGLSGGESNRKRWNVCPWGARREAHIHTLVHYELATPHQDDTQTSGTAHGAHTWHLTTPDDPISRKAWF